jgi:hypothetical protein
VGEMAKLLLENASRDGALATIFEEKAWDLAYILLFQNIVRSLALLGKGVFEFLEIPFV